MPATIRPAVRSLLIRSAAAGGGAVQGEDTSATCGERRSCVDDVHACRAGGRAVDAVGCGDHDEQLRRRPGRTCRSTSRLPATTRTSGPANPLADRCLATGTPKMPSATVNSAARTMTTRGAAMASLEMRSSRVGPPLSALTTPRGDLRGLLYSRGSQAKRSTRPAGAHDRAVTTTRSATCRPPGSACTRR